MKQVTIKIPIYTWNLTILIIESKEDIPKFKKAAGSFDIPDKQIVIEELSKGGHDGGKTYTKRSSRTLVMLIFPCLSKEAFINAINHEKRHVIDDILEWHNIRDKEAAGYLDGWLSVELFKQLKTVKAMRK